MTDQLLDETIREQVREIFQDLQNPLQVLFFGSETACDYCDDTLRLIREVAGLSEKISMTIYDLDRDAGVAAQFKVDKAPVLVIAGEAAGAPVDYGVRFAGIPAGHEFSSLIHVLVMISRQDSALQSDTRQALKALGQPVHLQVFVTPTCPYCPQAVVLAHQMALESPLVQAEAVEAMEFPDLANRFNVSGVPQTTINFGAGNVVGAVPEDHLLVEIQRALAVANPG